MFSSISKICDDMDVHIVGLNARESKDDDIRIDLTLSIHDRDQIEKMCRSLKSVPGITKVYRTNH